MKHILRQPSQAMSEPDTDPQEPAWTLVLAAALALAACQTTAKGSFCDITRLEAVRPSSQAEIDAMTQEKRENTLALLRKGAKLCGWRP